MTQTAVQEMARSFRESARWAGYDNDGYDRFASGKECALAEAAKRLETEGPEATLAWLTGRAAAHRAEAATADHTSYNPFSKGFADAAERAAAEIRESLAA